MRKRLISHDSAVLPIPALRDLNAPAQRKSRPCAPMVDAAVQEAGVMKDEWKLKLTDDQMWELLRIVEMRIAQCAEQDDRVFWGPRMDKAIDLLNGIEKHRKRIKVKP